MGQGLDDKLAQLGVSVGDDDGDEARARAEKKLAFLRLVPSTRELLYCHGALTFYCRDFAPRGTAAPCQLKFCYADDSIGYYAVNLSSQSAVAKAARQAIGRWPDLPVTYDKLVQDIHALQDLLRQQHRDLAGAGATIPNDAYVMSGAEEAEAMALLRSPLLLDTLDEMMERLGVVKEEHNRMMAYLAYTSRILEPPHKPINVVVRGESSTGKSFVARRVLDLFPSECYIELTDATPKSFNYDPDSDAYVHKIVYVQELLGSVATDYAIRAMQSEEVISTQTVEKNPQTGRHETRRITVKGPTMFMTTTTEGKINPENMTRVLFLYSDESREQTSRILDRIADSQNTDKSDEEKALRRWQNAQRLLKPQRPHMEHELSYDIRSVLPDSKTRVRRDAKKLFAMIASMTLLHQYQREHRVVDGVERLITTVDDVGYAMAIGAKSLGLSIGDVAPKTQQILEYCRDELTKPMSVGDDPAGDDPLDDEETTESFSWYQIVEGLGWNMRTVRKWGDPAVDIGVLEIVSSGGRGRGKTSRLRYNARMHKLVSLSFPKALRSWKPTPRIGEWAMISE